MKRLKLDNREELVEFAENTAQRMGESTFVLSVFTNNYKEGLDSLIQFGIAIMLDKPLFLLVAEGTVIPEKVKRLADGIEFYRDDDMESSKIATERLIRRAQERGFIA